MKEVLLHQPIDTSLVLIHHRHTLGQIDLVGSAVLQIAHIVHGRLRFSLNLWPIVTASIIFDVDRWWLVFLPSLVDFHHLITSCQYLQQLVMVEVETTARLQVPLECLCLVWPLGGRPLGGKAQTGVAGSKSSPPAESPSLGQRACDWVGVAWSAYCTCTDHHRPHQPCHSL